MWTTSDRFLRSALLLGIALTATYPLFIDTYRSMAFQTVPRDDYAPYLLWLVGDGGEKASAPMYFRVLSVVIALPFYFTLPAYRFTNLASVDPAYLRAAQALALTSWVALAGTAVLVYRIARDRLGAGSAGALAMFFATPLYARYTSTSGVDPLAMLLIAAGYYWLRSPAAFAAIVVASAAFNEKVPLVFALLLCARLIADMVATLRDYRTQLVACGIAVLGYVVVRRWVDVPGSERQLQPLTYVASALHLVRLSFTGKGLAQNVFPLALTLGAYAFVLHRRAFLSRWHWSPADAVVPLGLAAIGAAVDVEFTLGRLVAHSLPLVAPAAAAALDMGARPRTEDATSIPQTGT